MCDALTRLGCVPAKSLILKFPTKEQVPEEFTSDFIRSYFEGDGCIHFNDSPNGKDRYTCCIKIIGTRQFLEGMKTWLLSNGIESISLKEIDKKTESNTWKLNITNILDILKFKELIYDNYFKKNPNGDLFLQRKYNKFLEIKKYVNENININKLNKLKMYKKPEHIQKVKNMFNIEKIPVKKIAKDLEVSIDFIYTLLV